MPEPRDELAAARYVQEKCSDQLIGHRMHTTRVAARHVVSKEPREARTAAACRIRWSAVRSHPLLP